jgi:hypothetical protein
MKIIIELDSSTEQQPEIKKVGSSSTQQQHMASSDLSASSSSIDAGHAPIEGYATDSSRTNSTQQMPGNSSFPIAGAIDAGAARIQNETAVSSIMPDTGNMETANSENAFPAGAFVSPASN